MSAGARHDHEELGDIELAARVAARDAAAVRLLTQRNNQRLYRTAWSILQNRAEAEDAVQSTYLNAFAAIGSFEGRSSLSTWLTRIAINESLARARSAERRRAALDSSSVAVMDDYRDKLMRGSMSSLSPDGALAREQVRREQVREMLEQAIARLPEAFRLVFVLREVEELNVEETAETLDIEPATVRTRHFRARRRLRDELAHELKSVLSDTFPFRGADCTAMTARVVTAYLGPR
jgi:RNA polymerase sigma-70 factor, ECF subfamily